MKISITNQYVIYFLGLSIGFTFGFLLGFKHSLTLI